MKALTLTPPYGTLIALAAQRPDLGKRIETRSWATNYRGPLAIHQAQGLAPVGGRAGLYDLAFSDPDGWFYRSLHAAHMYCIDDLPRGAIVATCELVDCVQVLYEWPHNQLVSQRSRHILTDQERAFGDYTPGRFAWLLADVKMLPEPIPARGALGLWEWSGTP